MFGTRPSAACETSAEAEGRRTGVRARAIAIVLAALSLFSGAPAAASNPPTVLIVYADSRTLPGVAMFDESFRATLNRAAPPAIEVLSEFLELGRFRADGYSRAAASFLRDKYRNMKFVAVVAGGPTALEFLLEHGAAIFPDTTIVHAYVDQDWLASKSPQDFVVGVPLRYDVPKTIDLALGLHPGARRVVFVSGGGAMDHYLMGIFRSAAAARAGRAAFEFWGNLPMADLLVRLAALPPGTVVITGSVLQDGVGKWYTGRESVQAMSRVSTAPLYGIINPQVGSGLVGGYMPTLEETGEIVAGLVLRAAAGERLVQARLPASVPSRYLFDARQLERWGIAESRLPEGSVVLFRQPSIWERYRWQIEAGIAAGIVVLALCVAQAIVLGRLYRERRARRRSQAELMESETRMSLAAEAAKLASWSWDATTGAVTMTERGRAMMGLAAGRALDIAAFAAAIHAEDREAARAAIEGALRRDAGFEHEMRPAPAEGAARWVVLRGRPEFDAAGAPLRLRGVVIDVTARKEAQAEARRHRDQAAHLSRVTLLGQLSGALAHELNQPLSAILSNAEAAQRFLAQGQVDRDELREILADIIADDQRAGAVIERLRGLLKRGESQRRMLDVNEVVREVQRLCRSDLVTRNVRLDAELTPGLPAVEADSVQIQQVLLNLIVNACDAMEENEPRERAISVRTEAGGQGQVRIAVSDRGPGLAADDLERIFDPFVTSKPKGMGLGLAISRSIALAHGGALAVANNAGRGATFALTLPCQGAAAA